MKNLICAAVIVAAGNSSRMKNLGNKQLISVCGTPVLIRTVNAFSAARQIDEIVVVVHRDFVSEISSLIEKYNCKKVSAVVCGGETRQESVLKGLAQLGNSGFAAIHDGARPFIQPEKIDEAVLFAKEHGSAVLGVPLKDTAKVVDENENIISTPDRARLRMIQTPQIFKTEVLRRAFQKAISDNFCGTDDCSLVERLGETVHYIYGDYNNIKITTPEDIPVAEAVCKGGKQAVKVGFGYDVHALKKGRRFILGGVEIPHTEGLDGHSDADVLIHALMDALLGAAALGDIGKLFPDSDGSFKDIDSRILLRQVSDILKENGYSVNNIDITVAAQAPKLAPYIEKMRENISSDLGVSLSSVSVKATTTERLGFEGRKEGISAYAICSIL